MKISIKAVFVLLFGLAFPYPANAFVPADSRDGNALTATVTHEVCHRQVIMLGESATHGDGHTEAFKVALVERLVNKCGFDRVFFEASHYEFINIARRLRTGQAISVDQVSSAVGGLWKFDREFQPLVPFSWQRRRPGRSPSGA